MPTRFACSSCGLCFSTGSYHGFGSDGWFNALYCRHCGTAYTLRQSTEQFLDGFSSRSRPERHYEVKGPTTVQNVTLLEASDSPVPTLKCEACGAEGPFGATGPITDQPPEGINRTHWMELNPDETGVCPRCKQKAMKVTGEWIT